MALRRAHRHLWVPSETSTELRKYTRDLYGRLKAETGLATGFMPVGFIELVDPHINQWVDASQEQPR